MGLGFSTFGNNPAELTTWREGRNLFDRMESRQASVPAGGRTRMEPAGKKKKNDAGKEGRRGQRTPEDQLLNVERQMTDRNLVSGLGKGVKAKIEPLEKSYILEERREF